MIASEVLSEYADEREKLERTCSRRNKEKDSKPDEDEELSDKSSSQGSSEEQDNSSDEDFSLNSKRKSKKKRKKVKTKSTDNEPRKSRRSRKIPQAPSFDQVMEVQINHAQRFINYEDYDEDSESSGLVDDPDAFVNPENKEEKDPTPEPSKEKRKKIIIYPWNPIGITGGRLPTNDVSKLN